MRLTRAARWWLRSSMIVAGCFAPFTAGAEEPPRARLAYVHDAAIDGCPSERELRDSVAARLGYDPFAGAGSEEPRQILVQVRKRATGIAGSLDVVGPKPGQKEISSPRGDCRELVDALAVAIALAIDPASLSRPPAPPPAADAPEPPSKPEPVAQAPAEPPPERPVVPPEDRDHVRIVAGAGPRILFNELPDVVPAATVHVGLRWRSFEPRLEGLGTFAGSESRAGGGTVSASLMAVGLVPCAYVGIAHGCAGVTLGSLRAEGLDVAVRQRKSDLYASVDARAGVDVEVARAVALQVYVDLVAPLTRVALRLDGQDVFTVPSIGARAGASAMIRF